MERYGYENYTDEEQKLDEKLEQRFKVLKKRQIIGGIAVCLMILVINVAVLLQISGKYDSAFSDSLANEVSSNVENKVTQTLTAELLEQYAREYKYDDSSVPVGVYVASKNLYSVVDISCTGYYNASASIRGGSIQVQQSLIGSTASGMIINEDGYVLTNAHVVMHDDYEYSIQTYFGREQLVYEKVTKPYDTVTCKFYGSDTSYDLEIVAYDEALDLAVLKFKNGLPEKAKYVTFGDSAALNLGEYAIVTGNAYDLGISVTTGTVTNLRPDLTGYDLSYQTGEVIQTDAAINSGNSGGPVFDATGDCVAVSSFKIASSSTEGLNFGISSNLAVKYIDGVAAAKGIEIKVYTSYSDTRLAEILK